MRYVIGVVCAALLLVSCGSSQDADGQLADADQVVVTPSATSPLVTELGIASEPGQRQSQLLELQQRADAVLVQCMLDAGFFYVAPSAETSLRGGTELPDGSREWVQQKGLGITSSLIAAIAAQSQPVTPDAVETNLSYVNSLTPEQAGAYDRALIGEAAPGSTAAEYTPTGCWGAAYSDMFERLAIVETFGLELEQLNRRLLEDPRVVAFESTWSSCMDVAGYSYANQKALSDDIFARLLEIDLVDTDAGTRFASADEANTLAAYERAAALVSYDCSASFDAELQQLRFDYEREFLDDNRFRIAELQG